MQFSKLMVHISGNNSVEVLGQTLGLVWQCENFLTTHNAQLSLMDTTK